MFSGVSLLPIKTSASKNKDSSCCWRGARPRQALRRAWSWEHGYNNYMATRIAMMATTTVMGYSSYCYTVYDYYTLVSGKKTATIATMMAYR